MNALYILYDISRENVTHKTKNFLSRLDPGSSTRIQKVFKLKTLFTRCDDFEWEAAWAPDSTLWFLLQSVIVFKLKTMCNLLTINSLGVGQQKKG